MPLSLPLPPHLPPSHGPSAPHGSGPRQANGPNSATQVKMPTPPWMKGPLVLPPEQIIDFSKKPHRDRDRKSDDCDRSLTEKVRGGRSRHAVKRIVQSITKLRELDGPDVEEERPKQASGFEFAFDVPFEDGGLGSSDGGGRWVPWTRAEKLVFPRMKKEKVPTKAELSLPEAELGRLRAESVKMKEWLNVRKIGVSSDVVEEIRKKWRRSELVMLKFDLPLCRNMDRALEIVEVGT
ncbi:hypothetical protein ACLOJK_033048 [Asimina triloba]